MSIIDELWNGNIIPCAEIKVKGDPEYAHALFCYGESQEKLTKSMSDEQKALCDKFISDSELLSTVLERAAFRKGFCLGIKIMTEVPNE